jgi:hypothetical protein
MGTRSQVVIRYVMRSQSSAPEKDPASASCLKKVMGHTHPISRLCGTRDKYRPSPLIHPPQSPLAGPLANDAHGRKSPDTCAYYRIVGDLLAGLQFHSSSCEYFSALTRTVGRK